MRTGTLYATAQLDRAPRGVGPRLTGGIGEQIARAIGTEASLAGKSYVPAMPGVPAFVGLHSLYSG